MRVVRSIQHKSCADGSYMKEYELDSPLTKEFFEFLKYFGSVDAVQGLGDGYYNFNKPDWFSIKGFVGDTTVEVRYKRECMDITSDFVLLLFMKFKGEDTDLKFLKEKEKYREQRVRNLLRYDK